jgi:hypothetical protein
MVSEQFSVSLQLLMACSTYSMVAAVQKLESISVSPTLVIVCCTGLLQNPIEYLGTAGAKGQV